MAIIYVALQSSGKVESFNNEPSIPQIHVLPLARITHHVAVFGEHYPYA